MVRTLKWLFRPAVLLGISALLVAAAAAVVMPFDKGASQPRPAAVRAGEREVAWLYPATSTTQWERLANAVEQACRRLGLRRELDGGGTSAQAAPNIAVAWPDGKLVFRWYKVTSQWTPEAWVSALMMRDPPPVAVIGGNNSFWARELALRMEAATRGVPAGSRPLLLLTNATADYVPPVGGEPLDPDGVGVALTSIYPERTFRFCFSNRQMATAVTRFIWERPELTPDDDPAFLARWTDDPYSMDLFDGFKRVLPRRAADSVLAQWAFLSGAQALGLPAAARLAWIGSGYRHEGDVPIDIDSSVGSFTSPNPYEANAVGELLKAAGPELRRPLLLVTGQQQPSRRFLRDLARSDPDRARRFVVGMGDALSFNTIYRDRQVTWPIQDLPFSLVFFSHRDPTSADAGFSRASSASSGTEDVLLFRDIVEACALAARHGDLAEGLRRVRLVGDKLQLEEDGVPLFGARGQRASGTGEHVVYIRPKFAGRRVLPRATIEVWARQGSREWSRAGEPLDVSFNELEMQDGHAAPR